MRGAGLPQTPISGLVFSITAGYDPYSQVATPCKAVTISGRGRAGLTRRAVLHLAMAYDAAAGCLRLSAQIGGRTTTSSRVLTGGRNRGYCLSFSSQIASARLRRNYAARITLRWPMALEGGLTTESKQRGGPHSRTANRKVWIRKRDY